MKSKLVILGLILALMALPLAACAGPPGSQGAPGEPGLPGNPGQPGLQGPPAELPLATIVVIPAQGTAKTPITILGAGFKPGEEVMAEMQVKDTSIAMGYDEKVNGEPVRKYVADENGTFRIASKIPGSGAVEPGVYQVVATGDKGSKAVFPLEVVE